MCRKSDTKLFLQASDLLLHFAMPVEDDKKREALQVSLALRDLAVAEEGQHRTVAQAIADSSAALRKLEHSTPSDKLSRLTLTDELARLQRQLPNDVRFDWKRTTVRAIALWVESVSEHPLLIFVYPLHTAGTYDLRADDRANAIMFNQSLLLAEIYNALSALEVEA